MRGVHNLLLRSRFGDLDRDRTGDGFLDRRLDQRDRLPRSSNRLGPLSSTRRFLPSLKRREQLLGAVQTLSRLPSRVSIADPLDEILDGFTTSHTLEALLQDGLHLVVRVLLGRRGLRENLNVLHKELLVGALDRGSGLLGGSFGRFGLNSLGRTLVLLGNRSA
ncbi:hypothetical protein BV898_06884 [Hypsibius exemplaris]|uniref:Uncharacterized protein n=1 Tax=Hypsibius exemplaris TaxID=2072580 RepID=A0A1W0WUY9_HYPEX|nr:hypothetical protein BV898_06884 [Hypsibius exemplaris]